MDYVEWSIQVWDFIDSTINGQGCYMPPEIDEEELYNEGMTAYQAHYEILRRTPTYGKIYLERIS